MAPVVRFIHREPAPVSGVARPVGRKRTTEVGPVIDLAYVLGTVAFFALMLAYVRGCARLGRAAGAGAEPVSPEGRVP
jgi:hypothetical protein